MAFAALTGLFWKGGGRSAQEHVISVLGEGDGLFVAVYHMLV